MRGQTPSRSVIFHNTPVDKIHQVRYIWGGGRNPTVSLFFQNPLSGLLLVVTTLAVALLIVLIIIMRRNRITSRNRYHLQETLLAQEHQLNQAQRMEAVVIRAVSIVHNLNNRLFHLK